MSNGESRCDVQRSPHVPFIEAWEAHHHAVRRVCLFLTRSRDDADEAYSRTAVNAFQGWPAGICTLEEARRWLSAVARNACNDVFRERNRRREISLDAEIAGADEVTVATIGVSVGVEDHYLAREQMRRVLQCLRQLPFRLRGAAELHFVRELPYRDVARHLEISEVNVRKRIQQAKEVLRRAVAEEPRTAPAAREEDLPEEAPPLSLFAVVVERKDGVHRDAEIALPLARAADARQTAKLRDYVQRHPRGWRKRLALARALATAGAWREAVPHYRYALSKQPFPMQPWLELGTVVAVLGSREEAAAVYLEGSERTSREADRLQLRARAAALGGDAEQARSILRGLASDEDAGAVARQVRARGELALARGRVVEAAQAFEQALALDPADPLARLLHHDALLAWGRPLAAREQLVEVLRRGNGGLPAIERLVAMGCRARTASGEWDALLQTLRSEAPLRAGTHAAVALAALAAGHGAEAEATMRASVAANRKHAGAWLWLARIRGATGAAGPALMAAFTSLALDRENREAWLTAGELARQAKQASSARALWRRISAAFPDDPLMLAEAGLLAASSGAADAAVVLAAAARDHEPELPRLHLAHAHVLAAAGRDADAIAALRDAWDLLPRTDAHEDAARAALLLALCHGRLGEEVAERAWLRVAALRAALLEDTDPPLSFFLRGEALAAMQSHREALAAYREAAARHLAHPWRRTMTESVRWIVLRNSQDPHAPRSDE